MDRNKIETFKTPILLLIFNRPEKTSQVFSEIKKIKPSKLFVAADGPRINVTDDLLNCAKTRKILDMIDWPCEVKTLFRETNLGCKIAVSSGIDWFFTQVERGIILEDDCLPDQSFFPYCEELLERYSNDQSIMMISGFNAMEKIDIQSSYFFSKYAGIWGWATWKRAWSKYDVKIKSWADKTSKEKIKKRISNSKYWKIKRWVYDRVYIDKKDTWDYQWEYSILLNNGVSIVSQINLIKNIGYGLAATHTNSGDEQNPPEAHKIVIPLIHPKHIQTNNVYDDFLINRATNTKITIYKNIIKKNKEMLIKIIKNITPPFIYSLLQSLINKKSYQPRWTQFDYKPLSDIKIFFDPSGSWQKKMLSNTYDTYLFEKLKSIDAKGKVIFDIGAHIGFHSLYFAKLVGENGKVYSFEPNPVNFERFNLVLNNNKDIQKITHTFNVAVSDKSETVEFNINNDIESGRSSGNFIGEANTFWGKEVYVDKGFIKSKVKTIPIDSFRKELEITDLPDIIKIDVEGAEYLVLQGGRNLLLTKKPILYIEIHSILNMYNVLSFLNSISYTYTLINTEPNCPCFIEAKPTS